MGQEDFSIVILGAGKATRFKSDLPKLLHAIGGRLLGEYVLRTATAAGAERVYMVIGHRAEEMRKAFARPGLEFIEQTEQLGTGHALTVARPELERCASGVVIALVGDVPLLRPETLRGLVEAHVRERAACTILSMRPENPTGYGRLVRVGKRVRAIVEEKVATAAQKKLREVSTGILCFSREVLLSHLGELSNANAQGEYLLTDLIEIFNRAHLKVAAFEAPAEEVSGINDRAQMAEIARMLRLRKAAALMRDGVTLTDPQNVYIEEDVVIFGPDTTIEPGVTLRGSTRVGRGCWIQPYVTITDSILGDAVTVRQASVISNSEVAHGAAMGPFAHLRMGAVIEPEARIGNFVEVKKSRIGTGAKAQHLTYLGDASIGARSNIGAGTITCNYDGKNKFPTTIEEEVFIGSGNMLVAPVRIGKRSYTAAGSTITDDVPPESLAIGRGTRQVNKEGWVREQKKRREGGGA